MSNLNNNTTQLEALLAKVNALPEANEGVDTSDATATANEIFAGETAYTADGKVTGTFTIDDELTEQNDLISQISTLVATKAGGSGGASIDTCTVTYSGAMSSYAVFYTTYNDGVMSATWDMNQSATLENVVCGSAVYFRGAYLEMQVSGGQSVYCSSYGALYQAPTTSGATATVTLTQD